jgi:hypothetical protein
MCICLNCNYLNVCQQYFLIEKNHNEVNINSNPRFIPTQSIININLFLSKKNDIDLEWDIVECLSFKEKPGKWINYIN